MGWRLWKHTLLIGLTRGLPGNRSLLEIVWRSGISLDDGRASGKPGQQDLGEVPADG